MANQFAIEVCHRLPNVALNEKCPFILLGPDLGFNSHMNLVTGPTSYCNLTNSTFDKPKDSLTQEGLEMAAGWPSVGRVCRVIVTDERWSPVAEAMKRKQNTPQGIIDFTKLM